MSEAGVPLNSADAEEYYRRMTEEDPSDPSYLKKYAQFLYQVKISIGFFMLNYFCEIVLYLQPKTSFIDFEKA